VLSSAFVAGTPIGGIIVKGGKNPGGSFRTTQTNGYGEFEFTDLERGNYTISAELKYNMDEETIITVAGDAAENIVTSESNLKGEAARKGWDGTIKGNAKADNDQPQLRAQNNNTVRSNRTELKSILIEADLDGDGEYETDVTNKLNDEIVLDANGQETTPQQKAGISTSRSNIRNRSSLQVVSDGLYVSYGDAVINNKDVKVKTVLKTKHDTAKNSVGNIR
ncbi:MAG: carboxypeptidase-like regulatory domain-containing protein, partial [Bacteroidota bacterium]